MPPLSVSTVLIVAFITIVIIILVTVILTLINLVACEHLCTFLYRPSQIFCHSCSCLGFNHYHHLHCHRCHFNHSNLAAIWASTHLSLTSFTNLLFLLLGPILVWKRSVKWHFITSPERHRYKKNGANYVCSLYPGEWRQYLCSILFLLLRTPLATNIFSYVCCCCFWTSAAF